jgi:hypothetical protein
VRGGDVPGGLAGNNFLHYSLISLMDAGCLVPPEPRLFYAPASVSREPLHLTAKAHKAREGKPPDYPTGRLSGKRNPM